MLSHGQVLAGSHGNRWRVGRKVGEGRCCEVYLAEIVGEKIQGAVRVCKPGYDVSKKELYILRDVRRQRGPCPNLVTVVDTFVWKEKNVVVQELLDLDIFNIHQMAGGQGMSLYLIQTLLKDLIKALVDFHSCGYIHADIKPSNLMWSQQQGCLKMIDFGLSFHGNQQVRSQVQSRSYRAPEVLQNDLLPSGSQSLTSQPKTRTTSTSRSNRGKGHDLTPEGQVEGHTNINSNGHQGWPVESSEKATKTVIPASMVVQNNQNQNGKVKGRCLTPAIDMWSVGCLMHWMYSGQKMSILKPGGMTLCDQCKIFESNSKCEHSALVETNLVSLLQDKPRGWVAMLDLITRLIQCRPEKRLTAAEVTKHEFLCTDIDPDYVDLLVLPTRAVRLLNVIHERDLSGSQEDFEDLMSDIRLECEKYGVVESCRIPREGPGTGKAYIKYEFAADAMQAFEKLNGREFDGRTVITSYFPVKCLEAGKFF